MSEDIRNLRLDLREMQIKRFIRVKGQRLPDNIEELYEWLREFDDCNLNFIQKLIDGMEEFQRSCQRPLVISRTNLNEELNLAARLKGGAIS